MIHLSRCSLHHPSPSITFLILSCLSCTSWAGTFGHWHWHRQFIRTGERYLVQPPDFPCYYIWFPFFLKMAINQSTHWSNQTWTLSETAAKHSDIIVTSGPGASSDAGSGVQLLHRGDKLRLESGWFSPQWVLLYVRRWRFLVLRPPLPWLQVFKPMKLSS